MIPKVKLVYAYSSTLSAYFRTRNISVSHGNMMVSHRVKNLRNSEKLFGELTDTLQKFLNSR